MIQFINQYSPDKHYTFDERIALLRELKIYQTEEKSVPAARMRTTTV